MMLFFQVEVIIQYAFEWFMRIQTPYKIVASVIKLNQKLVKFDQDKEREISLSQNPGLCMVPVWFV
jgi:hypothetical protein